MHAQHEYGNFFTCLLPVLDFPYVHNGTIAIYRQSSVTHNARLQGQRQFMLAEELRQLYSEPAPLPFRRSRKGPKDLFVEGPATRWILPMGDSVGEWAGTEKFAVHEFPNGLSAHQELHLILIDQA